MNEQWYYDLANIKEDWEFIIILTNALLRHLAWNPYDDPLIVLNNWINEDAQHNKYMDRINEKIKTIIINNLNSSMHDKY
jgi:hypothetical protein